MRTTKTLIRLDVCVGWCEHISEGTFLTSPLSDLWLMWRHAMLRWYTYNATCLRNPLSCLQFMLRRAMLRRYTCDAICLLNSLRGRNKRWQFVWLIICFRLLLHYNESVLSLSNAFLLNTLQKIDAWMSAAVLFVFSHVLAAGRHWVLCVVSWWCLWLCVISTMFHWCGPLCEPNIYL